MGPVSRRGDEVLRTAGPWTANVHRLLQLCADVGVEGIPRALGYTEDGRERLSYLRGTVPAYPMPDWVWTGRVLDDAARLLRGLHDASVPLAGITEGWRSPVRQPAEVVCHNDFAPYNLVFDDGRLVGVIDFDYCSPGSRIWDLAYLAYRLAPLTGALDSEPFTTREREDRLAAAAGQLRAGRRGGRAPCHRRAPAPRPRRLQRRGVRETRQPRTGRPRRRLPRGRRPDRPADTCAPEPKQGRIPRFRVERNRGRFHFRSAKPGLRPSTSPAERKWNRPRSGSGGAGAEQAEPQF